MTGGLTAPRRRRWFNVSIRVLMGLVAVAAVGLAWIVQGARAQREGIAKIQRLHGIFTYDWRVRNGRLVRNATPPGPRWLRRIIGDEPFQDVISVVIARHQTGNQTADDTSLAHLAGLTGLINLHIDGAVITDAGLAHLRGLKCPPSPHEQPARPRRL